MAEDYPSTLPSAGAPQSAPTAALPDRYEDRGRIGSGGMGEVRKVFDRRLETLVAMKLIRFEVFDEPALSEQFRSEAKLTARLAHPGIVSVHDFGELPDGRVWFTMDLVRGRTFHAFIDDFHAANEGGSLHSLIDMLRRVAQAVAYAHSEGIVHRDLKPDNIMVGPFGEVLVMDWGIAGAGATTSFQGTPAYMPPEQLSAPGTADEAWDVYALGATLYQALSGVAPYSGHGVLERALAGPPRALSEFPHPIPAELQEVAAHAMHRDPTRRMQSASEFGLALQAWLEGSKRKQRALDLVLRAEALRPQVDEQLAASRRLSAAASTLLDGILPHEPVAKKLPGWRLLEESRVCQQAARLTQTEAMEHLRSALEVFPGLPEAREALAAHYRVRLESAEAQGNAEEAAVAEVLLRHHDTGTHATWLNGAGSVTLKTVPSGARVSAHRQEVVDRRLETTETLSLGETPLRGGSLPRGSWVLRLKHPGSEPVTYPVFLERSGTWNGQRPGESEPHPIHLPPTGSLGADDCYVPAGWFRSGGDPEAPDGLPLRSLWVDGFLIKRFPVTNGEYIAFLDDLWARGLREEATRFVPQEPHSGAEQGKPVWTVKNGRHVLSGGADAGTVGRSWGERDPVALLDHASARAYCTWLAAREGRPWRLPHDQEWEKAARGVDGRAYPFGGFVDPTWARLSNSDADQASHVSVDDYPLDCSLYGVRGLTGNSRDVCANGYRRAGSTGSLVDPTEEPDSPWRMLKGGSWFTTEAFARSAGRTVIRPEERRLGITLRPVASYPG